MGSRWLLQALTAINRTDLALALASQTSRPSWGYFASTVPGTLWETWEQTSGSFNHIMFGGGIDPWLYHNVGGIRPPSTHTTLPFGIGHRAIPRGHVELGVELVIAQHIQACNASIRVPGGTVTLAWTWQQSAREKWQLAYHVSVPLGYNASLRFPMYSTTDKVSAQAVRAFVESASLPSVVIWRMQGDAVANPEPDVVVERASGEQLVARLFGGSVTNIIIQYEGGAYSAAYI